MQEPNYAMELQNVPNTPFLRSVLMGQSAPPPPHPYTDREDFLLFVKILLQTLDPSLRQRAKFTVRDCTRRHRQGDLSCQPLQETVERQLKALVGERSFTQARWYTDYYCQRRQTAMV